MIKLTSCFSSMADIVAKKSYDTNGNTFALPGTSVNKKVSPINISDIMKMLIQHIQQHVLYSNT